MHSSSGQESGGGSSTHHGAVHVCNKCGWPFPNSHPSARHRRAHRKVCGTIEGYKLLDHPASLSDEERLSDDDHKTPTPSPKPAEKIGGNGERSNRSEDEVFSDAVTEFNETGLNTARSATEEHLEDARPAESNVGKIPSRNLTFFYSFKDNGVADIIEPPSNSTDSSPMPIPEVRENTANSSGSNPEFQAHVSSSIEESATTFSDDRNKLAHALNLIKPETSSSESQETKMINASADVAEGLMAYAGQETDAKGDGKIAADKATDTFLPNEYADQPSETESKSQEIQETTSHLLSTEGVALSKESHNDTMAAEMSRGDLSPGVESEHMNIIDTVPMNANENADAKGNLDFSSSVNPIEGYSGKAEVNDNAHELSVPANIPVIDQAEIKLEDFKDLKEVKSKNSIDTDSLEIVKDKEDDAEYPVSVENFTSSQSVQSNEVPKASASDLHVSEDNLMHEGSKPKVEKQSTERKSDVPQIKLTGNENSDELGMPVASVTTEMKESLPVSSVGEQSSSFICDDSLHKDSPETAVNILNDVHPMTSPEDANAIGLNDAGNHKKAINENKDVVGSDENRSAEEVINAKNRTTFSQSPAHRPEVPLNPTSKVHESDDADDHEKGKIENSVVMEVGREEEPVKEELSSSENATSLHKVEVAEDVMDMTVMDLTIMDMTAMKIPETKFGNLDTVSNTRGGQQQLEVSSNNKSQEKQVAEHDRGVELSERTSEKHAPEVPSFSPFGTESSTQTSVVLGGNHTGERGDSVTNLSLQRESIDNQQHLGASLVDASVDTLSQTDSVEANWGSISVLSTQSDAPVVEAETLPSTDYVASAETEKPSMKAKDATERQHSSKSDIFEAPSFMTLVEPGGGANHRTAAAAPQTQATQNFQQHDAASSQAGWFPSLTHTVNESEGRKKNEEVIAKVTNWSTGKLHVPLKNLLGEAKHEMRPRSPNPKENQAYATRKDETVSKDNGAAVTTVSSILGPEDTKKEMGKEGNSPAGYPADIKREKRKVKGRPYWAQFMCCSSVN